MVTRVPASYLGHPWRVRAAATVDGGVDGDGMMCPASCWVLWMTGRAIQLSQTCLGTNSFHACFVAIVLPQATKTSYTRKIV